MTSGLTFRSFITNIISPKTKNTKCFVLFLACNFLFSTKYDLALHNPSSADLYSTDLLVISTLVTSNQKTLVKSQLIGINQ